MSELNKKHTWKEEYNHRWVKSPDLSNFPKDAVYAGYDGDESNIYVGRAYHEGHLLPAKVVTKRSYVYVSVAHDGKEHQKVEFEVLCGAPVAWQKKSSCLNNSSVCYEDCFEYFPCAIPVGETSGGEKLFMGRSYHLGTLTPGIIDLNRNCLRLPCDWDENVKTDFEVMVYPRLQKDGSFSKTHLETTPHQASGLYEKSTWREYNHRWVKSPDLSNFPTDAVYVGYDGDGSNIYVGRANHEGHILPAKVVTKRNFVYVSVAYDGKEYQKAEFEVLCGPPVAWQKKSEYLDVGSAHYCEFFPIAMPVGETKYGEKLFMGRSFHRGTLTPGIIDLNRNCLLLPCDWDENVKTDFEVMVYPGLQKGRYCDESSPITHLDTTPPQLYDLKKKSTWREYNHRWARSPNLSSFPKDAVYVGYDGDGSSIYVGRAYHEGNLLPAKVVTKTNYVYVSVAYDGEEYEKLEFEVLCGSPVAWRKKSDYLNVSSAYCEYYFEVLLSAVPVGEMKGGEKLFIGRSFHRGSLTPGRIDVNRNRLLLPYDWHEHIKPDYEVMVYPRLRNVPDPTTAQLYAKSGEQSRLENLGKSAKTGTIKRIWCRYHKKMIEMGLFSQIFCGCCGNPEKGHYNDQ